MNMRIFDCHAHWSTERGYIFQTKEARESQRRIWGTEQVFETEDQMAATLRRNNVRAMMDLAFPVFSPMPLEDIQALHDYTFDVQRRHPDVIFGHWLSFDPRIGKAGLKEYERCVAAKAGFMGFGIIGQAPHGHPPSDPIWDPFYKLSIDAKIPVLIHTGLTGIGQGFPGGNGIVLDHGHPRHIDAVAAKFPDLKILAARPAYPWQDEMIAILLHKANVHYELHGWSPKTFSPALKREIGGRLQDRIMFGCDYPVLKYEMMIDRWRGLGYSQDVLDKVFHGNAERYFPGAALP
jgi:predicted TIM-barrel fold metal-dependent hydrolase